MAERRLFSKRITESDAFLDMPLSTQALYFHLAMHGDDDGFVNNPKRIMRTVGATEDELKLLAVKSFIIPFESGIVVIKHWLIHNSIRKDRYKPTVYAEEKNRLFVKENRAYSLTEGGGNNPLPSGEPLGEPNGNQTAPNGYLKLSQDKTSQDKTKNPNAVADGDPIPFGEIIGYLNEKARKNFRPSTESYRRHIRARWKEGYRLEDFKRVIDIKCASWDKPPKPGKKDTRTWLRPQTLFGTNFDSYLNEEMPKEVKDYGKYDR